jgi:hypothetical protein
VRRPAGFVCREAAGACDVAEQCGGSSVACPADGFQPATFVCRPSTGPCDTPDTCTGSSAVCPGDAGELDSDSDGVCDREDDCPTMAGPQSDADGDGTGDACDPCNNVVPVFASKGRIRIKNLTTPGGDDRLKFAGIVTVPTTPPIDPVSNGIRVLLVDGHGGAVLDATIPGGAGWKAAGTRWRYRNPSGLLGIIKVRIGSRRARPGTLKFNVVGKKASFPVAPGAVPVKGTIVIDSPLARTGQCGETAFSAAACTFNSSGSSLRCR